MMNNMSGAESIGLADLFMRWCPKRRPAGYAGIDLILDKLDALTNSISEGLSREIELRQKQYAYYRDLLLNFSKPQLEVMT